MNKLIALAAAMTAILSGPAAAQAAAYEVKAREIYAQVISFRTAAGQKQTPVMVAYLVEVLKASGVPEADIATLDHEGERALIVRLPGRKQGTPILFSAHMDVVDARREEWERNPFVRFWRGLDPEDGGRCSLGGEEGTVLVTSPDYDGKGKFLVRLDGGIERIVGASRVELA